MEGNISSGNMMPGSSYGGIDLQGSMSVHPHHHHHHHQNQQQHHHVGLQHHHSHPRHISVSHQPIQERFPLSIGIMPDCNQNITLNDYGKGEVGKSPSDDEEPNFTEDAGDGHNNDQSRGKKAPVWHRVKWTDQMVRLLITAVSYIGEEASAEYGGRRKLLNLHKKGKWKSVSKVMAERGHFVSPQQCEDKFNDLNKRYKRLNEILGKGTSCEVVENPTLLDVMDHLSEKAKEEVRKILSSKHLHYEEMCSYHNGNRLHLPPDPELQKSLRLALRTRDDNEENDMRRPLQDGNDDDDDLDAELDDHDEYEENHSLYGIQGGSSSAKKLKPNAGFGSSFGSLDCNKPFSFQPQNADQSTDVGIGENNLQKRWMDQRFVQLEEQKLHIQAQMLELERERFKWQRFSQKKDFELETMRMENERMKLENERMLLELKRKEMLAAADNSNVQFEV